MAQPPTPQASAADELARFVLQQRLLGGRFLFSAPGQITPYPWAARTALVKVSVSTRRIPRAALQRINHEAQKISKKWGVKITPLFGTMAMLKGALKTAAQPTADIEWSVV